LGSTRFFTFLPYSVLWDLVRLRRDLTIFVLTPGKLPRKMLFLPYLKSLTNCGFTRNDSVFETTLCGTYFLSPLASQSSSDCQVKVDICFGCSCPFFITSGKKVSSLSEGGFPLIVLSPVLNLESLATLFSPPHLYFPSQTLHETPLLSGTGARLRQLFYLVA